MLQQFSWGQFLLASFVLSFLWYCFVGLVFYRSELMGVFGLLGSERDVPQQLPNRRFSDAESLDEADGPSDGLREGAGSPLRDDDFGNGVLGKSAVPDGMAVMGMGQLAFAGDLDGRHSEVGLVSDVIQELKLIFSTLEKQAGDKQDFFVLLEKVKSDYGRIGAHPNIGAINAFIVDHVPFHLTSDELENLWY